MKTKTLYAVILVVALIAAAFAGLWAYEKNEKTKWMKALCESSIQQSYEHFSAYKKFAADEEYWYGVTEYYSFVKAYIQLCDGAQQPNHNALNKAYGSMVLRAENVRENMDSLLEALTLLSENIYDPNAMIRLNEFNHAIE